MVRRSVLTALLPLCVAGAALRRADDGARNLAGVMNVIGAALAEPAECTSLSCTLTVDAVTYTGPSASFKTRGYNGGIPGPTIRAKAGDTLVVNLVNDLLDNDNTANEMNTYRTPNTTNLHTHGLHVSATAPQDDAFLEVEPGHSYEYTYQIPSNHMGGTFWYHPHHHGSTALQAGGGMAGLLIIDDAADEVPPVIAAMEEVILMFMHVPMSTLKTIQNGFNAWMWTITGTTADVLLTNGQSAPTLTVAPGRWYRFRMSYAAVEATATMSFIASTSTAACELQLLAKDGIYLTVPERDPDPPPPPLWTAVMRACIRAHPCSDLTHGCVPALPDGGLL